MRDELGRGPHDYGDGAFLQDEHETPTGDGDDNAPHDSLRWREHTYTLSLAPHHECQREDPAIPAGETLDPHRIPDLEISQGRGGEVRLVVIVVVAGVVVFEHDFGVRTHKDAPGPSVLVSHPDQATLEIDSGNDPFNFDPSEIGRVVTRELGRVVRPRGRGHKQHSNNKRGDASWQPPPDDRFTVMMYAAPRKFPTPPVRRLGGIRIPRASVGVTGSRWGAGGGLFAGGGLRDRWQWRGGDWNEGRMGKPRCAAGGREGFSLRGKDATGSRQIEQIGDGKGETTMNWYVEVLKKYTDFNGRAGRAEFWMFSLISLIISLFLYVIDKRIMPGSGIQVLYTLYSLAVLVPSLAVSIRRLHDTGRSGWWILINVIPILGQLVYLVFLLRDSQPAANQYGSSPKMATA